jgi:hypothetical protein
VRDLAIGTIGTARARAILAKSVLRLADGRTRPSYDVMLRAVDVMTLTKR